MRNNTRVKFDEYMDRQAELNGMSPSHARTQFSLEPSVEQKLEDKVQQSSELLQKINIIPVEEQKGQKLGLDVGAPVSSTNTSNTERREPSAVDSLDDDEYLCEQINVDTFIPYAKLDMWAKFPDFQQRITNQIVKRRALDKIMIGFNGQVRSSRSDRVANPLLQDVAVGWLQKYRNRAPARVMRGVTLTARDDDNKIIARGMYGNLDALVLDATSSLLDVWYQKNPGLVVITGNKVVLDRHYAIVNALSASNPNSEALAAQLLVAQQKINGLPTFVAPFFPDGTLFITAFENLSIYWQEGSHRRHVKDEPELNRISTYESSNDAYVIEDYGFGCLIEDITKAE